jgi:type IV pilus assembly protein PilE
MPIATVSGCGKRSVSYQYGFTLIEILIVVAIVAILAAIALPSYRSSILKSRRADAIQVLSEGAVIMERCYAQNFSYNAACANTPPAVSAQGFYTVALTSGATTFTLTASAKGTQVGDTLCQTFSVDQAGQKIGLDSGGAQQSGCWRP